MSWDDDFETVGEKLVNAYLEEYKKAREKAIMEKCTTCKYAMKCNPLRSPMPSLYEEGGCKPRTIGFRCPKYAQSKTVKEWEPIKKRFLRISDECLIKEAKK